MYNINKIWKLKRVQLSYGGVIKSDVHWCNVFMWCSCRLSIMDQFVGASCPLLTQHSIEDDSNHHKLQKHPQQISKYLKPFQKIEMAVYVLVENLCVFSEV